MELIPFRRHASRTQCSSHKILTPRNSGSMKWREEMRWDDVLVTPLSSAANDLENSGIANVVLVVELCARSILNPPPPAQEEGSGEIEEGRTAAEGEHVRVNDSITSAGDKHGRGSQSFVGLDTQPLKKKRKFAQDMHLGSLVIPLTDLPLEDATHNRDGEAGTWCPCML